LPELYRCAKLRSGGVHVARGLHAPAHVCVSFQNGLRKF
jgi:hypothetical protein